MSDVAARLDAVWRIEGPSVIATLARVTGDVALAEDLASEAALAALQQWETEGVPRNPGAWLTAVAKRRAIDAWRRGARQDQNLRALAPLIEEIDQLDQIDQIDGEPIPDDRLQLIFIACHPVLSRPSQVALTLRTVGGLSTAEIARMLLTSVPTVQARITRAKRTLSAAAVPFEAPEPHEWHDRLTGVLGVISLIFTEGYAATRGDVLIRDGLAREALRLGRVLVGMLPRESEVHALVALMELQASRLAARTDEHGEAVLLADQDRSRWDRGRIHRGREALQRADDLGRGRGPYALQAAIAQCHAVAPSVAATDWELIVVLYETLGRITPNPIVELNRAVAVSMADGPEAALLLVEEIASEGQLVGSHLVPSVRGELLARLGRTSEAEAQLLEASELAANERVANTLRRKAAAL